MIAVATESGCCAASVARCSSHASCLLASRVCVGSSLSCEDLVDLLIEILRRLARAPLRERVRAIGEVEGGEGHVEADQTIDQQRAVLKVNIVPPLPAPPASARKLLHLHACVVPAWSKQPRLRADLPPSLTLPPPLASKHPISACRALQSHIWLDHLASGERSMTDSEPHQRHGGNASVIERAGGACVGLEA